MLYQCNIGVRDYYTTTNAMLNNSLFYYYMLDHGLQVYKEQSTRDIITLKFDFGSKSYQTQRKRVLSLIRKTKSPEEKKSFQKVLEKVDSHKNKYHEMTREQIRTLFYKQGVDVCYEYKDKQGKIEYAELIHYKMLFRTPAKAKIGEVMFIRSELYDVAHEWLTMGIKLPDHGAKIVEMSAYAPLTTSTIVGTIDIPVENIVILKDQDSFFKTIAEVVRAQDYIKKNGQASKRCVVTEEQTEVMNELWDGQGLGDISVFPDYCNGMMLLRNHMFKACVFKTRLQDFFRDWCSSTGNDYQTYQIQDMFGEKHRLKDIAVLTTDNAIKWKKFYKQMGGTLQSAYQFWKQRIRADNCKWGIVKTDHPSKLGDWQQMSYQIVNTLPLTKEQIFEVAKTSVDYIALLKKDNEAYIDYLRKNANDINHYDLIIALYEHNPTFANSKWFRREKTVVVRSLIDKFRNGKIYVNADNLTVCGNPYALLLYSVGQDFMNDPTLQVQDGAIQCYTKRFEDGEYLAAFRSPHNATNGICHLHNVYHPLMQKYFDFSPNILVVNCIGTDIQPRCNGADFDSDFFYTTNQPQMVKAAKIAYRDYPSIVNKLDESGIVYDNIPQAYAMMDIRLSRAQRAIGESSNRCQLAVGYYITELMKENPDPQALKSYYEDIVILSVGAQIAIDSCKKTFSVDIQEEIERIKQKPYNIKTVTKEVDGEYVVEKKDFPLFMKYTRDVPHTRNGIDIPKDQVKTERNRIAQRIDPQIVCPMNWLQEALDNIPHGSTAGCFPTEDYFIKMPGGINSHMITRIYNIVAEYSHARRDLLLWDPTEDSGFQVSSLLEQTIKKLKTLRIRNKVSVNRLIQTSLNLWNSGKRGVRKDFQMRNAKYARQIMNCLYRMDPELFLSNFTTQPVIHSKSVTGDPENGQKSGIDLI